MLKTAERRADTRTRMLVLGLLAIVVATVPLAGGRLGRLGGIAFRRRWAGVAALVAQSAILRLFDHGDPALLGALHVATYALLFVFLTANLDVPGLVVLAAGGALNALAITANHGVMPARPGALAAAGIPDAAGAFVNSGAVADPRLWFLGDVFAVPHGLPLANVFSVGDLLVLAGAFLLVHRQCRSRLAPGLERAARRVFDAGARVAVVRDNREFRRLFGAQAISSIGDWVFTPAVYAALVRGHARSSELALLLVVQIGPGMVVGLVGGPFIDRFSRKWLMAGTDVLRAAAVGSLLLSGPPSLMHVYGVAFALGVGGALFQPAFMAALPNLVPARSLTQANALVGLTQSLAVMVGFPLGGLIVDQFGVRWGFTANAVSFVVSGVLVAGTVVPRVARTGVTGSLVAELAEGFRIVRANRTVRAVVLVVATITLAAGIKSPLESLFALRSLGADTTGYGLLVALWGAGMLLGSLVVSRLDERIGRGALLTLSLGVVALAVTLASASPALAPVGALWVAAGVANSTGTVAYETILQTATPDAVRGRVMAVLEAAVQAGLLAGVGLAALTGTVFSGPGAARPGMALSGLAFGAAALGSWLFVQGGRRRWSVRGLEVVPATEGVALLRVALDGPAEAPAPVLLVHDGAREHRVEALPGGPPGQAGGGRRRLGYRVPAGLLAHSALALDVGRGRIALPQPS